MPSLDVFLRSLLRRGRPNTRFPAASSQRVGHQRSSTSTAAGSSISESLAAGGRWRQAYCATVAGDEYQTNGERDAGSRAAANAMLAMFPAAAAALVAAAGSAGAQTATSPSSVVACEPPPPEQQQAPPDGLGEGSPAATGMAASNEHTSKWRVFTDRAVGLIKEGKLEEAEGWLRVAMQEAVDGFGDETPHVAAAMNNLAECLRLQGRFSEAEPMYLRGLELLERAFGKEDPRVGQAHHNLVGYYINTKQVAKAQARADRALKIFLASLGKNHPQVLSSMFVLADLLHAQGKHRDAIALQLEAMDLLEGSGELHTKVGLGRIHKVVLALADAGRLREADLLLARLLKVLERQDEPNSPQIAMMAMMHGWVLKTLGGRWRDTEAAFQQAKDIRTRAVGQSHPLTVASSLHAAEAQLELGDDAATKRAKSGLKVAEQAAKDFWHEATDTSPGFSVGGWNLSLSWSSKPKAAKPRHGEEQAEAEQLWAALQYSHALRLAAAGCCSPLRAPSEASPSDDDASAAAASAAAAAAAALEEASGRLEEAYLVINSTVAFSSQTKRDILRGGKAAKGKDPIAPLVSMSYVLSSHRQLLRQHLEELLAAELLRLLDDIRELLREHCVGGESNSTSAASGGGFVMSDSAQRLQEIVKMERLW